MPFRSNLPSNCTSASNLTHRRAVWGIWHRHDSNLRRIFPRKFCHIDVLGEEFCTNLVPNRSWLYPRQICHTHTHIGWYQITHGSIHLKFVTTTCRVRDFAWRWGKTAHLHFASIHYLSERSLRFFPSKFFPLQIIFSASIFFSQIFRAPGPLSPPGLMGSGIKFILAYIITIFFCQFWKKNLIYI